MEIIGCGKGHYYNPELYSSCPECAKENGASAGLGVTEPVNFGDFSGRVDTIGATDPVNFNSFAGGVSEIGATEPVSEVSRAASFGAASSGSDLNIGVINTDFFRDSGNAGSSSGSKVQDYGKTVPVMPDTGEKSGSGNGGSGSVPFMPVVGWLVCIEGAAKGRDYRIHGQYNYIGRGQHMDICISGDDCISTERAAIIAYDPQEKFYSFGPGMGHNVVRVNGKMLMNAVVLNPYDELTIGKTKLLFVPLCGERFDWNGK